MKKLLDFSQMTNVAKIILLSCVIFIGIYFYYAQKFDIHHYDWKLLLTLIIAYLFLANTANCMITGKCTTSAWIIVGLVILNVLTLVIYIYYKDIQSFDDISYIFEEERKFRKKYIDKTDSTKLT